MSDLAAFLRARLGEDEAAAKAADQTSGGKWWAFDDLDIPADGAALPDVTHIRTWSPARVLREAGAMRKIVNSLEADLRAGARTDLTQGGQIALTYTVRTLASIYSDHPDYDPAWNPETAKPPPAGGMAGGG